MNRDSAKALMQKRILDAADQLFYARGIRGVGVDAVAKEIGISKRTLYNHFPSKDALVLAYLSRHFIQIPSSERSPAEQILRTFDRLERSFAGTYFRGCPFVNAVAEVSDPVDNVKEIAVAFKESRRIWFRGLLIQLGVSNPEELATQMVLLVDGAIAQALVRGDPKMARAGKNAATVLLRAAGVELPPVELTD